MAPSRSHQPRKITSSPSSRNGALSARQRDRLGPAPGELEQTPARLARRPRHRAGAKEIAAPQVAPVARVMRDELRQRPVEMPQVRTADDCGALPAARIRADDSVTSSRSRSRRERDLLASRDTAAVRDRPRAHERRRAERFERLERHDPWRDRRGEALGEKWTEWLVFPRLDVARRPVVQQAHAEHMLLRRRSIRIGIPERVRRGR